MFKVGDRVITNNSVGLKSNKAYIIKDIKPMYKVMAYNTSLDIPMLKIFTKFGYRWFNSSKFKLESEVNFNKTLSDILK